VCILWRKTQEASIVAGKDIGIEVNADKTKCTVKSRGRNAGRSRNLKIDNKSFGRMEQFQHLGKTPKNQNSVREELKGRLELGNACYHSVEGLLYSLSKYVQIRYREL
jgi:hypothetical protein